MNDRKHTPGPWSTGIVFGFTEVVAPTLNVANIRGSTIPEQEANARLIAAAPDLLEACAEFVRKCNCGEARSTRSYAQMQAAIAKATGE
jgi:hypothetical protein